MIELRFILGCKEDEHPVDEVEICLTSALHSLECHEGNIDRKEFLRRVADTVLQAALIGNADYRVQLSGPDDLNEGMSEGKWELSESYITIRAVHHVPPAKGDSLYY